MVAARLGKTDVIETKHPKATNGLQLRVGQLAFICFEFDRHRN